MRRISPGGIAGWLADRLRGARYLLGDLGYAIASGLGAAGRGIALIVRLIGRIILGTASAIAAFWGGLSVYAKRRWLTAAGAVVVLLLFFGLAVPNLPCQFPGGDRCPPDDDAAEIVPADALAYLHANLDPETEQAENLADVASRVPLFSEQLTARALVLLPGAEEGAPNFEREIEPWFGGEIAIALIAGSATGSGQVILLEAEDPDGAARYADSIASGRPQTERYREVEISVDERGFAGAQVDGFLALGSRSSVRAIIDTTAGAENARALADDEFAEEIRGELPDHRFVEAWLTRAGAEELAGGSRGALAPLAPLVSSATTEGAAFSISAGDDSLVFAVRSKLDPEREKASPGFFAAFPGFEPTLDEELPADSLAYLGFGRPEKTVEALLEQAAVEAPGVLGGFQRLVERLRRRHGLEVERELLPALGEEAAMLIAPSGGEQDSPGGIPYLALVAKGVDEEKARRAFARLQGPLAAAVDPGRARQAPVFGESRIGDVEVRSLRLSPAIELAYSVFDELAVLATQQAGIADAAADEDPVGETDAFERATDGFEDELSLIGFLDLEGLVAEGFEIGAAQIPAFNTFAADLRALDALGLSVRIEDELLRTDARLLLAAQEK